MGPPAKHFSDGVFLAAESSRILHAYWELVDQFLSLHVFIPRPRLWRGATGNRKVIAVFLFTDNNRQQPTTAVNNRQQPSTTDNKPTITDNNRQRPRSTDNKCCLA